MAEQSVNKGGLRPASPSPTVDPYHKRSDVDFDHHSLHHTIGTGHNQAASGAALKKLKELVESGGGGSGILYGAGPPSSLVGETGDFYFDDTSNVLYGPKGAGGPVMSDVMSGQGTAWTAGSPQGLGAAYNIGQRYEVNTHMIVTGLRWWRANTAATSRVLKLWNATTTTLLGTTLPTSETGLPAGQWVNANFAVPIEANDGDMLTVCVDLPVGDAYNYLDSSLPSATAHLTNRSGNYVSNPPGGYPNTERGANHYADILFQVYESTGTEVWPVALTSGGGGGGGSGYVHEQNFVTAANTWTVVHGQGTKGLDVRTYNDIGIEIIGDITYLDSNTVEVDFYYPRSGYARVWN